MHCERCQSIDFEELRQGANCQHHNSLQELRNCADTAQCALCKLFWTCLKQGVNDDVIKTHLAGIVYMHGTIEDTGIRLKGFLNEKLQGHGLGYTNNTMGSIIQVTSGPDFDDNGVQISQAYSNVAVYADPGTLAATHLTSRCLSRSNPQQRSQLPLSWLNQCEKEHMECGSKKDYLMPTRLLSIGTNSNPTLKLASTDGQLGKYAALSYFWGEDNKREITLRNANKNQYYEHVDETAMCQSHKDGIQIARELGLNYIWIDALCIIQDNTADWEEQSAKMSFVYGNASITIVGGSASDSREGFIGHALNGQSESAALVYISPSTGEIAGNCNVISSRSIDVGPVDYRAWCFQESILSRRMLVYGKDQLAFKCRQDSRWEDGAELPYHWGVLGNYVFGQASSNPASGSHEIEALRFWYQLLNIYTTKHLWQPSDIFAALAGIAYLFQQALGTRYLAGLWECNMWQGLLWTTNQMVFGPNSTTPLTERRHKLNPKRKEEDEVRNFTTLRAPSWSWASVTGPVYQAKPSHRNALKYATESNWRCFPGYEDKSWTPDVWDPRTVVMKPCHLHVKGRLLPIRCSHISVAEYPGRIRGFSRSKWNKHGIILEVAGDVIPTKDSDEEPAVVGVGIFDTSDRETSERMYCMLVTVDEGLILQIVSSDNGRKFRRLGIFSLVDKVAFKGPLVGIILT